MTFVKQDAEAMPEARLVWLETESVNMDEIRIPLAGLREEDYASDEWMSRFTILAQRREARGDNWGTYGTATAGWWSGREDEAWRPILSVHGVANTVSLVRLGDQLDDLVAAANRWVKIRDDVWDRIQERFVRERSEALDGIARWLTGAGV